MEKTFQGNNFPWQYALNTFSDSFNVKYDGQSCQAVHSVL